MVDAGWCNYFVLNGIMEEKAIWVECTGKGMTRREVELQTKERTGDTMVVGTKYKRGRSV